MSFNGSMMPDVFRAPVPSVMGMPSMPSTSAIDASQLIAKFTSPSGSSNAVAGLSSANPFAEVAQRFNDWWTKWVSSGYADWDKSADSIRKQYDDWMSDPSGMYPGADPTWLNQPGIIETRSGGGCSNWYLFYAGNGCTHDNEVTKVLTCYSNLVHNGYREFDYTTTAAERDSLYHAIATCSGVDYERVWPIMVIAHDLFFNPKNGRTVHPAVMYPLAWEKQQQNRATPKEDDTISGGLDRFAKAAGDAISDLVNGLKWAAIIIGIGAVIYFGVQLYENGTVSAPRMGR